MSNEPKTFKDASKERALLIKPVWYDTTQKLNRIKYSSFNEKSILTKRKK